MDNLQMPIRAPFVEGAALNLMGDSPKMQSLRASIGKVARTGAPVLITGEIGTGKELVARMIHQQSGRHGAFVVVNCASLPAGLFRAEVFGSDLANRDGAQRRSAGRIEAAQGGTLFLDEVGDLPLEMQTLLLRFLQEGTFEQAGSGQPVTADVRIITATHLDLERLSHTGAFREDLYYRLGELHLETAPLRERENDVEMLADHFLADFARQYGGKQLRFSQATRRHMRGYSWPGNIRELRNRVMQAVVMCDVDSLAPEHLGFDPGKGINDGARPKAMVSLREKRQLAEREAITQALRASQGQVPAAAASLGISRAQLYRLIGRLRLSHRTMDLGLDGSQKHEPMA